MKTIFPNTMRFCIVASVTILLFSSQPAFSQTGVKIAATAGTAHPSSMLDVESTTKGVLVPRMNSSQRAAISGPAEGLLVYQTDAPAGYWYFNGSVWIQMGVGAISGSGTANFVPKWTTANSQGNSTISDDGTTVTTSGQFDVTGGTGTNYITSPIEIRTTNNPRLSFHWPGVVASQIGMDAAGVIRTYNNPGTAYEQFAASNITANGILTTTSYINNGGVIYQNTSAGQGSGAHGISWYTPSFVTWFDYMAPAGGTNAPSGTAAPSDGTSGVTSWALRSNIESVANYGWIWESGVNTAGNAPTVKFSINSNNGTFHATGNGIIDGTLKIAGGSPAAGRVLTSDASGNATWAPAAGGSDNLGNHVATTALNMNGNAINNMQAMNSVADHLEFMSGVHADDNTYEWLGFYSGGTRQGIFLYDGAWTGANNVTNEFSLTAEGSNLLTLNTQANHVAIMPKGGNVGIGTLGPGHKLEVIGNIRSSGETYTQNWFRNQQSGVGLYNEATGAGIYSPSGNLMTLYGSSSLQITSAQTTAGNLRFDAANPYITSGTGSYFVAPGGAYFNSNTVYTEAAIQERGGVSNDGGNFGGDVQVNENLRIAGVVTCIQGNCPSNSAIRLTPNLHLNSNGGNAVILNWDNGTTGNTQTMRIGNGAGTDVFQVWGSGATGIGISVAPSTLYQLNVQRTQLTASGDGQSTIYGFRTRDSQNDGVGYGIGSTNNAITGYDFWGDVYTFGVHGASFGDFTRTGGVLGSVSGTGAWTVCGYKASNSVLFGLYCTATTYNGTTNTNGGYAPENANVIEGIGAGMRGGVIGNWSRGDVMGQVSAGELFASYNMGNEYTSGYQAELVNTGSKRVAAYSVTSTDVKVYDDGEGSLNGTSVFVPFDKNYAEMLGSKPRVTVSPVGSSASIFIKSIEKNGFTVASDNAVNVQFSWIAVGKRVDAENKPELPADLADQNFDANMKGVMFNENNKEQSATPVWYDGQKVRFDKAPEQKIVKKEDTQNAAEAKAQSDKVNELIQNAAKNQAVVNPAADAPTLERFPAKNTAREAAPVLVSPVAEKKQ